MATAAYLQLCREKLLSKPRRLKQRNLSAEKAVCGSLHRIISSGELLILQEWTVSGDQEAADHTNDALMAGCVMQAASKRLGAAECG